MAGIGTPVQAERDYGKDNNKEDDRKSYGKDKDNNNNNIYYKSSKESSKSVNVKKINCNNINININGGGQGVNNGNDENGDNSSANGNKTNNDGLKKFYKKDGFEFVCVNNNDNRQITPTPPPTPPTPPPSTDNNVYIVWESEISNGEIFFTVSTDGGQTFSTPENLSDSDENSENRQITSEGDNVYVVWQEGSVGNRDIFFATSNDNGQNFSSSENISNNTGDSGEPRISSEGNNVYVVWSEFLFDNLNSREIFFVESNNNGQTFSTPAENISNTPEFSSYAHQISTEEDNVYVVWSDETEDDDTFIFFTVSTDNGQTFSTPAENLSNNIAQESFDPQISSSVS